MFRPHSLLQYCAWLLVLAVACLGWAEGADGKTGVSNLFALRGVWQAHFNDDGTRVLVQMRGGEVGLWDVKSGKMVAGDLGGMTQSGAAFMDGKGRCFVVGFANGGARVYDAKTAAALSPPLEVKLHQPEEHEAVFSPDLSKVVLLDPKYTAQVFDIKSGKGLARMALTSGEPETEISVFAKFAEDGRSCFVMDLKGVLRRYDTDGWKPVGEPMPHPNGEGYHFGFEVSGDGKYAVTFDRAGENGPKGDLQLWDVKAARALGKVITAVNGLGGRFSRDSSRLVVAPGRGTASVYEVPSLKRIYDLPSHDDVEGPQVVATPDERWLITRGYSASIAVTDGATGKLEHRANGEVRISNVVVAPDSKHCFVVYDNNGYAASKNTDDYDVVKHSLPDLKNVGSIRKLASVSRVEASPDGSRLLIVEGGDDRERVRIFDAAIMKELVVNE